MNTPHHPAVAMRRVAARPHVHYRVGMPQPWTHVYEVTVIIPALDQHDIELCMPAWTPGSYMIREFARNVFALEAWAGGSAAKGKRLDVTRVDKDTWRVHQKKQGVVTVRFCSYAFEHSVRTAHLDDTHGFFQPTNILPYVKGRLDLAAVLEIEPFGDWRIACPLPRVTSRANSWFANDYDTLADSPVECGNFETTSFAVDGKPHEIAVYGWGNYNLEAMCHDFEAIVRAQKKMFGNKLPYDNYVFIIHALPECRGGLEHLNSQVSHFPSMDFVQRDRYLDFLSLISHEYFHIWNVKRIRPAVLGPFDYSREQYTDELWICEGLTVYYEWLMLLRAGRATREDVLAAWCKDIETWENTPGQHVMSVREASFLAWTRYYRQDENYVNTGISYYLKGGLIGMLLDIRMREMSGGRLSLDDVMRRLLADYGWPKPGFGKGTLESVVEELTGESWRTWFRHHLDDAGPLELGKALRVMGLELKRAPKTNGKGPASNGAPGTQEAVLAPHGKHEPWLGWDLKARAGMLIVSAVRTGSPAMDGGISAKDELLALDGARVKTLEEVAALLAMYKPGDQVEIAVFRRDMLRTLTVHVGERESGKRVIVPLAGASATAKRLLKGWLG